MHSLHIYYVIPNKNKNQALDFIFVIFRYKQLQYTNITKCNDYYRNYRTLSAQFSVITCIIIFNTKCNQCS